MKVIICGAGQVGYGIAERRMNERQRLVLRPDCDIRVPRGVVVFRLPRSRVAFLDPPGEGPERVLARAGGHRRGERLEQWGGHEQRRPRIAPPPAFEK